MQNRIMNVIYLCCYGLEQLREQLFVPKDTSRAHNIKDYKTNTTELKSGSVLSTVNPHRQIPLILVTYLYLSLLVFMNEMIVPAKKNRLLTSK